MHPYLEKYTPKDRSTTERGIKRGIPLIRRDGYMNSSGTNPINFAKEDYDCIPVYYCEQCLSLRIKSVPGISGTDYCDNCNSTSIGKTDIHTWETIYETRYGYKFLEKPKYT